MIPIFTIILPGCEAILNVTFLQAATLTDYGLDILMIDPRANLCLRCPPAEAKAIFASLNNLLRAVNGQPLGIES